MEWSGVEWSGVEWSGVGWGGVKCALWPRDDLPVIGARSVADGLGATYASSCVASPRSSS